MHYYSQELYFANIREVDRSRIQHSREKCAYIY